jgi:hypothetical protein
MFLRSRLRGRAAAASLAMKIYSLVSSALGRRRGVSIIRTGAKAARTSGMLVGG